MRKSTAAAIFAVCTATAACGQGHAQNGGTTVSRSFQVGNFQQIEVAGPYEVEVRTGANPAVSAQGSQKLLDQTVVEVEGGKLLIHPQEQHHFFQWGFGSHGKARFTVTVPQLSGATIAGSGDIRVDRVNGANFEGAVAGSGGLDIGALDVQSLKLSIAGSGGVKARSGRAQSARYEIAGSGDLDARGIATQQVKVSIAGSGGVQAHASGTADVSIMGSGDVEVAGGAKCSVSKAGSGNVRCS
jgi:Putative auto-transporter adhesin, head GIN domain